MQNVTIQLHPTPELLDSFRAVVRAELANYTPPAPTHPDLPEFLTRKETAKLLRISLVTLHEWTKANVVQSNDVNGRIRYRRDHVLPLIKEVDTLKYKQK